MTVLRSTNGEISGERASERGATWRTGRRQRSLPPPGKSDELGPNSPLSFLFPWTVQSSEEMPSLCPHKQEKRFMRLFEEISNCKFEKGPDMQGPEVW